MYQVLRYLISYNIYENIDNKLRINRKSTIQPILRLSLTDKFRTELDKNSIESGSTTLTKDDKTKIIIPNDMCFGRAIEFIFSYKSPMIPSFDITCECIDSFHFSTSSKFTPPCLPSS